MGLISVFWIAKTKDADNDDDDGWLVKGFGHKRDCG